MSLCAWRLAYISGFEYSAKKCCQIFDQHQKKGGNVFYYETGGKASLISSMQPTRIFPDDSANLGEEERSKAIEQLWKQDKAAES